VHKVRPDYREWRSVRQVQKSQSQSAAPFLSPSRRRKLLLGVPSRPSSQSSRPPPSTHSIRRLISRLRILDLPDRPGAGNFRGNKPAEREHCPLRVVALTVAYAREPRLECPCHQGFFPVKDGSVLQGSPLRPLLQITLERCGSPKLQPGPKTGRFLVE
jgi:hypothetical protein